MVALFKHGHIIPSEYTAELAVEDVCFGPAFPEGAPIPLEGE